MLRTILGAVAGVVVWVAVVVGVSFVIGMVAPDFNEAMKAHATDTALASRLGISFIGTLAAGAIAAMIGGTRAPVLAGVLLLLIFVPYHMTIWGQFPLWYHLTYFVSLPVLSFVGGKFAKR